MAKTDEEKAAEAADAQAVKDAEAIEKGKLGRAANPKLGGESFDYGAVDEKERASVLGAEYTKPVGDGDRRAADDFNYGGPPQD